MSVYDYAQRLLDNVKLTSDNVELNECYYLCANRQHIEDLKTNDHQVVWGRRGTGKTTLLKAFTYEINNIVMHPETIAIYIILSKTIPSSAEIAAVEGDGSSLAAYVYTNIIGEVVASLEVYYNNRKNSIDSDQEQAFLNAFYMLQDYIDVYKKYISGGEYQIDNLRSTELQNEIKKEYGIEINATKSIINAILKLFGSRNKQHTEKSSYEISGKVNFILETNKICELITTMITSLGIGKVYLSLDEYSEIDKVSEYSIQSKVAEFLKQTFFKSSIFSVKIATIWNRTKFHTRGGPGIQGIEYKQDIFPGPDLDIMFMESNAEVIEYFKQVLINTYCMGEEMSDSTKQNLREYFVNIIFGEENFRQLICGSQGISRSYMILIKEYLRQFNKKKNGRLKQDQVFELIRHQYVEDIRYKLALKYTVYQTIEKYITNNLTRYFLITRDDYTRCKSIIKYLAARGYFMQIPGQITDRRIRDEYKLFVIHYGNYLDALESEKHKSGRKKITEDSKLLPDGMLIPEYSEDLLNNPAQYTVVLPIGVENEVVCTNCNTLTYKQQGIDKINCPKCGKQIQDFEMFVDDVAI